MSAIGQQQSTSILFVCLGNICRSPLAEGVFRTVADERGLSDAFLFDSAGTGGWHRGDPPDPRSVSVATKYGVDISAQRARQLTSKDFMKFHLIFGMDSDNVANIKGAGSGNAQIALFMEACTGRRSNVPDPYYGTEQDFEVVYRMIRSAADSWFDRTTGRFSG